LSLFNFFGLVEAAKIYFLVKVGSMENGKKPRNNKKSQDFETCGIETKDMHITIFLYTKQLI